MIFDLLAPPQGPRGRVSKNCAVVHAIHVSNSHKIWFPKKYIFDPHPPGTPKSHPWGMTQAT